MSLLLLPGPIISASLVLGALGVLAIAAYFLMQFRTLAGYRALAPDLRRLAARLRSGDIRRESSDVIVSGLYRKFPVTLRFSNDEYSPGVALQLNAPINLSLSVYPKAAEEGPGRAAIRAGDPHIDNRFVLRSDAPMEAKLFLGSRICLAEIKNLCCSPESRMAIRPGSIEFLEMLIPNDAVPHLESHLRSLAALADSAAQLPGSERVKVAPLNKRGLSPVVTLTVGCLVLFIGWLALVGRSDQSLVTAGAQADPLAAPAFKGWHVADASAFDDGFAAWLVRSRVSALGHVALVNDQGNVGADAYLLTGADSSRRVVITSGGSILYDSSFPHLAGLARVSRQAMAGVNWADTGAPSDPPQSDGVLLVRNDSDPATGRILFVQGGRVQSGQPRDYQQVRLSAP